MKKIGLIILSIMCSILLTELILRYIIMYPQYGLSYKVHYRKGGDYWTNVWKPNSKYWSVEGGNKVFKRNNVGLPGIDIDKKAKNNIVLLGSSYLEGYQISPEKIATSVFADLLSKNGYREAVYNLGCSGHDPYDSYFRTIYYEKEINQNLTILVINSDNAQWFKRHSRPYDFNPDQSFGTIKSGKLSRYVTILRNKSSLAALLANVKLNHSSNKTDTEIITSINKKNVPVITEELLQTLIAFRTRYSRLIILSIVNDQDFNKRLISYCTDNGIYCFASPLLTKDNMIGGKGHLNEAGNQKLGEFIFSSFNNYNKHR